MVARAYLGMQATHLVILVAALVMGCSGKLDDDDWDTAYLGPSGGESEGGVSGCEIGDFCFSAEGSSYAGEEEAMCAGGTDLPSGCEVDSAVAQCRFNEGTEWQTTLYYYDADADLEALETACGEEGGVWSML